MDEFDAFISKNADIKPAQYTESKQKKIARLLEKDVFRVVTTINIPINAQIFNSHFINKVKNTGTDKAYKKSWLIILAYNDQEKELVLTQSPAIQQVS